MQDRSPRVHRRPPFNYNHSVYLAGGAAAKARSLGHCQKCGRKRPLEAHHWSMTYPPAHLTTPDDLTAFCRDCHDEAHDFRFFLDAGGSPDDYRAAHSELVAILLRPADDGRQVGRVAWFEEEWGALVTGRSRPRVDEDFWLFLRSTRAWRHVVVTEVVDGRPGHWRVRKRFLGPSNEIQTAVRPSTCSPLPMVPASVVLADAPLGAGA